MTLTFDWGFPLLTIGLIAHCLSAQLNFLPSELIPLRATEL